jgi:ABC-type nitrate/sulfonate/bicarbonate transport system substrate-binding protein
MTTSSAAPDTDAGGNATPGRAVFYTRCPVPTASSIAIAEGWLDREYAGSGVAVHSLRAQDDRSVRRSHFTHDQHNLFRQGGIVPPLWAYSRGAGLRLLGISNVPRFQGIIVLAGSDIAEPSDLRCRRLGVPRRTAEPVDFWRAHTLRSLLAGLDIAGLSESDVALVDLPTSDPFHTVTSSSPTGSLWTAREAARLQSPEVLALLDGRVDAIYTYAPTGLPLIELLDARVVVDLRDAAGGSPGVGTLTVLTVSDQLLATNADDVVRYVVATLRAAVWAAAHPRETTRIFAAEEGVAEEWAQIAFGSDLHRQLEPTLTEVLLGRLQQEADFLHDREFLATKVDVRAWAAPEVLAAARRALETDSSTDSESNSLVDADRPDAHGDDDRAVAIDSHAR